MAVRNESNETVDDTHRDYSPFVKQVLAFSSKNPLKGDGYYEIDDAWNVDLQTRSTMSPIEPDDKIILLAGDSFTFGDGILHKDTFGGLLQKEKIFKNYKVINIAQRGASNSLINLILTRWCNVYGSQVEMVIIGYSFRSRRIFFASSDKLPDFGCCNNINPGHVPTGRFDKPWVKEVYKANLTLSTFENDTNDFETNVLVTKGLGKIHNFKTYWWSIEENERWNREPNRLENNTELVDDDDFKFIDIADAFGKTFEEELVYHISEEDGHWSEKGHSAIADRIIEAIDEC